MPEISLVAESGRSAGTRPSRRLRAEGKVPGVVYGQGSEPVSVAVDRRELRQALSGPAGVNAVINLDVGGTTQPTVVKSLQRDPVRRRVTHIDFLIVNLSEEITMDVPIVLQGEAKAVLDAGGLLEHHLTALAVTTTPRNIPNELVVDVSGLDLGDSVRVGDIALPAGVTTSVDPDTTVVTGVATRAAVAAEEEAEGEAAEGEGAEGEGSEGASAAAEGGDAE
jgi:large subunit ribosomal protein L25